MDGRKIQSMMSIILLVNRILATVIISFLPRFSVWQFSAVCILYQDPFTDYLLCVSSDERVAGHNERITHENHHTILTSVRPGLYPM